MELIELDEIARNSKETNKTNSGFTSAEKMRQLSESHSLSREKVASIQRERIMYLIQLKAGTGGTDIYYDCSDGTADYIDYVDEEIIEELRQKGYKAEYDDSFKGVLYISW